MDYIVNPTNRKRYHIQSTQGKLLLKKYLKFVNLDGGVREKSKRKKIKTKMGKLAKKKVPQTIDTRIKYGKLKKTREKSKKKCNSITDTNMALLSCAKVTTRWRI